MHYYERLENLTLPSPSLHTRHTHTHISPSINPLRSARARLQCRDARSLPGSHRRQRCLHNIILGFHHNTPHACNPMSALLESSPRAFRRICKSVTSTNAGRHKHHTMRTSHANAAYSAGMAGLCVPCKHMRGYVMCAVLRCQNKSVCLLILWRGRSMAAAPRRDTKEVLIYMYDV